ncbi:MAG: bifunctional folylpolyglutamate synthase/dihydrofolate synthase [Candidatus Eremiobacteraeota bacterium]|nr:bifunctional folylpolyglutamate synthase/dihydrofolate synthase [Candidatus Eremiobacteraeota bacterium]
MDFAAAQSYLIGTINETVSRRMPYRLERMRTFLAELGDPQNAYPTIHIGGTSGKGSTSTMVAAMMRAEGRRVGLHTKPHLKSMTERARIDGIAISEERFAEILGSMMPAIGRTVAVAGRPTYYETLLAIAFEYFAQERVDIAVIEVGLGGRLDGTNVITPLVSGITSIGFDHMDVLGETLEDIALEKAGIAKPGIPLVTFIDDDAARAVVAEAAQRAGAPFIDVAEDVRIEDVRLPRAGQSFSVVTPLARYDISTPMLGEFQRRNAATGISIAEALPPPFRPSVSQVEQAFASLTIPGRMEFYPGHPSVLFDIAHNAEKAEHLVRSLREHFPDRRFTFVVAIGESKDSYEILRLFATLPVKFIFTSFEIAGRAATKPQRLAAIAESIGSWGRVVQDPVEAMEIARRTSGADEIIVVTGSTFIVAEIRGWWLETIVAA